MNKYYLFIINNNTYKIYKNNPDILYRILDTLYNLSRNNLNYGVSIYNNICDVFSVKLLNNYIKEKFNTRTYNKKIKLHNEKTYITINYSRVIIETNKINKNLFKVFKIYNKRIMVINFKKKEYYFLNEYI